MKLTGKHKCAIGVANTEVKMKEIVLTQGYKAKVTESDYESLNAHNWHVFDSRGVMYAARTVHFAGEKSLVFMHRAILGGATQEVDHVDGNGLNNQRSNLRTATRQENARNRGPDRTNTSGYKGVHWCKTKRGWVVSIDTGSKRISIGLFASKEMAAWAYNHAAKLHFGAFAYLNEVK